MVNASASRPPVLLRIIAYEFASVLHHCALRVVATPSESFLRMWQSLVVGPPGSGSVQELPTTRPEHPGPSSTGGLSNYAARNEQCF